MTNLRFARYACLWVIAGCARGVSSAYDAGLDDDFDPVRLVDASPDTKTSSAPSEGDDASVTRPTADGSVAGPDATSPACGDGTCQASESCSTCSDDCGACPGCGDGTCGASEFCSTCPDDCGACATQCGDATCSAPTETCTSCPSDCGACEGAACGDGSCQVSESCSTCAVDCGPCTDSTSGCGTCSLLTYGRTSDCVGNTLYRCFEGTCLVNMPCGDKTCVRPGDDAYCE